MEKSLASCARNSAFGSDAAMFSAENPVRSKPPMRLRAMLPPPMKATRELSKEIFVPAVIERCGQPYVSSAELHPADWRFSLRVLLSHPKQEVQEALPSLDSSRIAERAFS